MKKMFVTEGLRKIYRLLLSEQKRSYIYRKYRYLPEAPSVEHVFATYARRKKNCFFVQIGANDGISNDPLFVYANAFRWRGLLVEPVKYIFEDLVANYRNNPRIIFENKAIGTENGWRDFFYFPPTDAAIPKWYRGLGSFYTDVIFKHRYAIPNIEDYLVQEKVETITLDCLLKKYNVEHVDIVHSDTEGFDSEIIRMLDFERLQPDLILFEHKHLAKRDYEDCLSLLAAKNFCFFFDYQDTLCFHRERVGYLSKEHYKY